MRNFDLSTLFQSLPEKASVTEDQIIVITADFENSFVVGFDADENLVLIGPQFDDFDRVTEEKFRLEPNKSFEFTGLKIDRAYMLTFRANDDLDFLVAIGVIGGLKELNDQLQSKVPSRAIIRLARSLANKNFSALEIGLYGELVVLLKNIENRNLMNSWHSNLEDAFDFAYMNSRLEVKTTVNGIRKHWFSESQISNRGSVNLWIASVQLAPTYSGKTCTDLRELIESQLDSESLKVFQIKCESYNWEEFSLGFDLDSALSSIAYFNSEDLPQPSRESPEITSIKWQLDLSLIATVPSEQVSILLSI